MSSLKYIKLLLLIVVPFLANLAFAQAPIKTNATSMFLIDLDSNEVMFSKNSNERFTPASLTKLMTSYILFDNIKNNFVKLDDLVTISENAWRMKGSRSFLEVRSKVTIETLLKGLIVQSGNDAAVAIAEHIAGSESNFAEIMNDTAKSLGMLDSNFVNASGWPHSNQFSTVRDIATLASAIIKNFPQFYSYYNIRAFSHNNISQKNRNPLLYMNIGADGIKTGYTEESGYSLAASAVKNNRRILTVLTGLNSEAERAREGARIVRIAFSDWQQINSYKVGDNVASIPVIGSDVKSINITVEKDAIFLIPKVIRSKVKLQISYQSPIIAPITKGQNLGSLTLSMPDGKDKIINLVATQDATNLGLIDRVIDNVNFILFGYG